MGAISAFSTTRRVLEQNTVLFVAAFAVTLANFVPSGIQTLFPPSASVMLSILMSLLTFLITPFLLAGLLAMADEGLDGTARLGTFIEGGKNNYLRMLGAMVLVAVLTWVVVMAIAVGLVLLSIFVGAGMPGPGGSMAQAAGNMALLVIFGLVGLFAMLLPVFFLQFYGPAVVVSNLSIVDALKRSAGLVRRNFVSTLGYTAISMLVGLLSGVVALVVVLAVGFTSSNMVGMTTPEFGVVTMVIIATLIAIFSTFITAFGTAYQVAFYDDCLDSIA